MGIPGPEPSRENTPRPVPPLRHIDRAVDRASLISVRSGSSTGSTPWMTPFASPRVAKSDLDPRSPRDTPRSNAEAPPPGPDVVDRSLSAALECKLQGDLHGALQCFQAALKLDTSEKLGRRLTTWLNIASVHNTLGKPHSALEQASKVIQQLEKPAPSPLFQAIRAKSPAIVYNRRAMRQIADLSQIPESLHVLLPAAWMQCAVSLRAMGKQVLGELAQQRGNDLEELMVRKCDQHAKRNHSSILLPQRPSKPRKKRPSTAKARATQWRPARPTSARPARQQRPATAQPASTRRGRPAQPSNPARSRPASGSNARNLSARSGRTPFGTEQEDTGTRATFHPPSRHQSARSTERRPVKPRPPDAANHRRTKSPELQPHSAQMILFGGSLGNSNHQGPETPPRQQRQSTYADFGCSSGPDEVVVATESEYDSMYRAQINAAAACMIQKTARGYKTRRQRKQGQQQTLATQQLKAGLLGYLSRAQVSKQFETLRALRPTELENWCDFTAAEQPDSEATSPREGGATSPREHVPSWGTTPACSPRELDLTLPYANMTEPSVPGISTEKIASPFLGADPRSPRGSQLESPRELPARAPVESPVKSLKEEIFEVKAELPVFAQELAQSEMLYPSPRGNDNSLKGTARAVIKQLERLDRKNLFKLQAATRAWVDGGNLAGIESV